MTQEEFNRYAQKFELNCKQILSNRATQYQTQEEPLYNFTIGGEIIGLSPFQTCWAYMSKHIAAMRKKVQTNDVLDADDLLEKCTDIANYAKLMYIVGMAMADEYNAQLTRNGEENADKPV